jgi:hypothetical protein
VVTGVLLALFALLAGAALWMLAAPHDVVADVAADQTPRVAPLAAPAVATGSRDDDAASPTIAPVAAVAPAVPAAAAPTEPASDIPAGLGRINGVVVDHRGRPIANADVRLVWSDGRPVSKRVDESGRFSFDSAAADDDTVLANAPGYHDNDPQRVQVIEGHVANLRITLDESSALRGTVRDKQTHAAIANARIDVGGTHTRSDDSGRFEVLSLPDGPFSIHVRAAGHMAIDLGGLRGDRSGDEEIDVELEPGDGQQIIGTGFLIGPAGDDAKALLVARVYPDTPAAEVLQDGDLITAIDGTGTGDMPLSDAMSLIRGQEGTRAHLAIVRAGQNLNVDVERRRISVPARADD